jgi:hypothetical protein
MLVAEFTINELAVIPPKATSVVPVKPAPVIVTACPVAALVGVKEEIAGTGMNVKFVLDTAVPPGVIILIGPDAPEPSVALILEVETNVNDVAGVPPKLTAVTPVKLVPVIVTVAPLAPVVGVNDVMVGAGMNVNPAEEAVPPGVVTLTLPEAPVPTTAVMVVADTTV